ncbi:unnamed protein product [Symbiodinium sp. CCMP2456]|nr:unnamed protein product [Symbiodinium sp. CCMP2456]
MGRSARRGANASIEQARQITRRLVALRAEGQWAQVLNLLRAAQSGRVGWNIVHCNAALSALADASQWSRQLRIFATLQEHQVRPTASTFGALLAGAVASWEGALALLKEMPQWQVQRDTVACNTAITACARAAQWEAACELVKSMQLATQRADTITQNALMSALHQGSQWEHALKLLASSHHGRRTVVTWSTCISAQEASGRWQVALELLAGMCREVGGSTIGYNACISVCARGQAWSMAFRLLEDMPEKRVQPDTVSFNATISAASEGAQWQPALGLFDQMMQERVPHDLVSFNATMDACAMSGEWRPALSLLWAAGAQANLVSFNTALTACHRGSAWAAALALFALLQRRNLRPDTLSYNVMMSVGHKSARWPLALQMLRSLRHHRLAPSDRRAMGVGLGALPGPGSGFGSEVAGGLQRGPERLCEGCAVGERHAPLPQLAALPKTRRGVAELTAVCPGCCRTLGGHPGAASTSWTAAR